MTIFQEIKDSFRRLYLEDQWPWLVRFSSGRRVFHHQRQRALPRQASKTSLRGGVRRRAYCATLFESQNGRRRLEYQDATYLYLLPRAGVSFNREHVIPEAFGAFKGNLVLRDCVCVACNTYFGRELDLILSRDSGEALLRLRHGIKPVSEARDLRNIRVKLRVNVAGLWYGSQIILKSDESGTKLESEQVPQVGFRKGSGSDFAWFTEDELDDPRKFEQYRHGTEILIVGPSEEVMRRLSDRLRELAVPFKRQGVIPQPLAQNGQIETLALYQIDQIILRAVGKIALNYAASVQGASFVLRADFDEFRRYVRHGEEPPLRPAILPSIQPILYDDSAQWRQTNGHLITFGWSTDRKGILVQVSLFNSITYQVSLCPHLSGLWYPLSAGHHFDIKSRIVCKLRSTDRVRIPTAWT